VPAGEQFFDKRGGPLPSFDTDCRIELSAYEVAAMQRDDPEEPGFFR